MLVSNGIFFPRVGKFAFTVKGKLGAYAPLRIGATTVVATDVKHRVEFSDSKNHRVTWRVALPQLDLPVPAITCACTVAFGQLAAGGAMPADVNAITATPDGRISNVFKINLINRLAVPEQVWLEAEGLEGAEIVGLQTPVELKSGQVFEAQVLVLVPQKMARGSHPFRFQAHNQKDLKNSKESSFFVP